MALTDELTARTDIASFEVFPWNKNFETGYATIDEQHQILVDLLNKLAKTLIAKEEIEVNKAFEELANYATMHFGAEEAIWSEHFGSDPWLSSHKRVHTSFLPRVIELKEQDPGKPLADVVEDIVKFLIHWLAFHIIDNDKRMSLAVEAMSSGASVEEAKLLADKKMSGAMRVLIESVLDMYDKLSGKAIALMRERQARLKAEKELQEANKALQADIIARERAEQALAKSEQRFALAMKGANDGLWDWDLQTSKVYFSPRWKSMLGYAEDELENVFETWEKLVHPDDLGGAKRSIDKYFAGRKSNYEASYRMRHKKGHWVHILSRGFAVRSESDGTPVRFVGTHVDITERVRLEEELKKLATTDKLTQAYNRTKFDEIIARELKRVKRYRRFLSLVMLDIDNFKAINDTHGHIVGDSVLRALADVLRSNKREIDYLVRWGGEEFMIVAPETDIEGAKVLAERIRKAVENHQFDTVGRVTVSLGATQLRQDDSEDNFIKRADDSLYKAKTTGRNKLVIDL